MKHTNYTQTFLLAMAVAALTFTAAKVSAFPLYLNSASGIITSTASYGTTSATTSNRVEIGSVGLRRILTLVSNEVAIRTGTNTPASIRIAYDPYTFTTYLTNSSGYYYNLSGVARFSINDIATSFHGTGNHGGVENDAILVEFQVSGTAPDGKFYEFQVKGRGTLVASLNGTTGIAYVGITLSNGSGYGELKGSDDGVSTGGFTLRGSGKPPVNEPYSVFWWNN